MFSNFINSSCFRNKHKDLEFCICIISKNKIEYIFFHISVFSVQWKVYGHRKILIFREFNCNLMIITENITYIVALSMYFIILTKLGFKSSQYITILHLRSLSVIMFQHSTFLNFWSCDIKGAQVLRQTE